MTLALVAAVVWSVYSVWSVTRDLKEAQAHATRMGAALVAGRYDELALEGDALFESARSAADGSDGPLWWAMGRMPIVGDDLDAVATVAASLDEASSGAVVPLLREIRVVDRVAVGGRIDTDLIEELAPQARDGADAIRGAGERIEDLRPSDYVSAIGDAVLQWKTVVGEANRTANDAASSLEVLPALLGEERPQRILLVFQNNAEVRATGGLPGSWSLIEADDGRLRVVRQGSGGLIDSETGAAPTSPAEQALWGQQLGLYFRDANMTSDFPRAAALMRKHWDAFGGAPLDGIVSVDVVAMEYVLRGLGPVEVSGFPVDSGNVRSVLLNGIYENLPPSEQDAVFAEFARLVVSRLTDAGLQSPPDLLLGVGRAIIEDRLHVAWFDPQITGRLAGSRLEGAFETRASSTPLVDVTLNDATGSKMSYFLRHEVEVEAQQCDAGRQLLEGRLTVWQTVDPRKAASFAPYVTGAGYFGVPAGNQVVLTRIFGPVDGRITDVRIGDRPIEPTLTGPPSFQGRPVVTLALQPDVEPTEVLWTMVTGRNQPGPVRTRVTPGAVPSSQSSQATSAC